MSLESEKLPLLCGLDEAGRGPMAGPVCAAAVILPYDFDISILDDSKKLNEKKRIHAAQTIMASEALWCIGWASAAEIDEINILQASLLAMKRSYEGLLEKTGISNSIRVIVDGLYCPSIHAVECSSCVKADSLYPAVMAASILAKTARDRMMQRYSWLYPEYGYDRHKGYPTQAHIHVLQKNGPSPIQRHSFRLKNEGQLVLF